MNFADQGLGLDRPSPANDNAQKTLPRQSARQNACKSARKAATGGLHLRLSGAEVLISHYLDGVGLGVVTGEIRCGVSLSREDAQALAYALLNEAT
jgi:hypothetical protein